MAIASTLLINPRPQHGDDEDRQQQRREREQDVHAAHQDVVESPAEEPGDEADDRADDHGEGDRGGAGEQRDARPEDEPAELVAAVLVETHQVLDLGVVAAEQVHARLLQPALVGGRVEEHLVRPKGAISGANTAMPMISVASTRPIRPDHEWRICLKTSRHLLGDGTGTRCGVDRAPRRAVARPSSAPSRRRCPGPAVMRHAPGIEGQRVQQIGDQVDEHEGDADDEGEALDNGVVARA